MARPRLGRPGRRWRRRSGHRVGRAGPETAPAVAILTSRHRLWQRYGADGVFAVERAAGELMEGMSAHGLAAALVYTDDSPLLTRLGLLPAEAGDPASVARLVRALAERMAWLEEELRYVLILGDDGVVPFHRRANPSPDGDEELISDHPYGTEPEEPLRPVRAVGRMPDAGLELLLAQLRFAAAAHRRRAAGRLPVPAPAAVGYSASVWRRAARGVFAEIGRPQALRLSPPRMDGDLPPPAGQAPHYFNLHGLPDSASWFGQRDPAFRAGYAAFPVALRPEDLPPMPGTVVLSEACYGAALAGRGVRDSVALTALAGGALAFVGATGVAYGGLDGPLVAADLLARGFWQALRRGLPAGEALAVAKWQVVREALARLGYVDAEDVKAVTNFVLYGDPSLTHPVPFARAEDPAVVGRARDAVEPAGPAELVGTPPVRPQVKLGQAPAWPLVEEVRWAVARRLPEFASGEVQVSLSPSPQRVVAKAAATGSHRADPPGQALVVTLATSVPMGDGHARDAVVHITVDPRGHIRKLAMSR